MNSGTNATHVGPGFRVVCSRFSSCTTHQVSEYLFGLVFRSPDRHRKLGLYRRCTLSFLQSRCIARSVWPCPLSSFSSEILAKNDKIKATASSPQRRSVLDCVLFNQPFLYLLSFMCLSVFLCACLSLHRQLTSPTWKECASCAGWRGWTTSPWCPARELPLRARCSTLKSRANAKRYTVLGKVAIGGWHAQPSEICVRQVCFSSSLRCFTWAVFCCSLTEAKDSVRLFGVAQSMS